MMIDDCVDGINV